MEKYSKKINFNNYKMLNNSVLFNKDREIAPDNIIILYNYNSLGEIYFDLAEIINKKTGEYIVLKSGESRKLFPFEGYSKNNKFMFEDIERSDNIVFAKMYHFESPKVSRIYRINDLKQKLPYNENSEVLYFPNLNFGEYGKTQKLYYFYYLDRYNVFKNEKSSVADWLEFEQDFNKIYQHFRYNGKNYLQVDEEKVLQALEVAKKEHNKSMESFRKKFKIKSLGGTITESMYR